MSSDEQMMPDWTGCSLPGWEVLIVSLILARDMLHLCSELVQAASLQTGCGGKSSQLSTAVLECVCALQLAVVACRLVTQQYGEGMCWKRASYRTGVTLQAGQAATSHNSKTERQCGDMTVRQAAVDRKSHCESRDR